MSRIEGTEIGDADGQYISYGALGYEYLFNYDALSYCLYNPCLLESNVTVHCDSRLRIRM